MKYEVWKWEREHIPGMLDKYSESFVGKFAVQDILAIDPPVDFDEIHCLGFEDYTDFDAARVSEIITEFDAPTDKNVIKLIILNLNNAVADEVVAINYIIESLGLVDVTDHVGYELRQLFVSSNDQPSLEVLGAFKKEGGKS